MKLCSSQRIKVAIQNVNSDDEQNSKFAIICAHYQVLHRCGDFKKSSSLERGEKWAFLSLQKVENALCKNENSPIVASCKNASSFEQYSLQRGSKGKCLIFCRQFFESRNGAQKCGKRDFKEGEIDHIAWPYQMLNTTYFF